MYRLERLDDLLVELIDATQDNMNIIEIKRNIIIFVKGIMKEYERQSSYWYRSSKQLQEELNRLYDTEIQRLKKQ